MSDKRELIDIAGQLQSITDRLLQCCKDMDNEDSEEDDSEDEKYPKISMPSKAGMIAMVLKKKLGK